MRTKAVYLVCGLTVALMIIVVIRGWPDAPAPTQVETQVAATSSVAENNNLPLPQAAAKTDGYQLIVGANPRFNKEQVFLPPTNSVVITNEEQLNLLIEQEKKARQQQQTTQQ